MRLRVSAWKITLIPQNYHGGFLFLYVNREIKTLFISLADKELILGIYYIFNWFQHKLIFFDHSELYMQQFQGGYENKRKNTPEDVISIFLICFDFDWFEKPPRYLNKKKKSKQAVE